MPTPDIEALERIASTPGPRRLGIVRLPDELSNYRMDHEHARRLGPLSLVNLFVGPNNAGKSKLLRSLFTGIGATPDLVVGDHAALTQPLETVARQALWTTINFTTNREARSDDASNLHAKADAALNQLDAQTLWSADAIASLLDTLTRSVTLWRSLAVRGASPFRHDQETPRAMDAARAAIERAMAALYRGPLRVQSSYLPVFRTLRPLRTDDATPLSRAVRADYFPGTALDGSKPNKTIEVRKRTVFTGEDLYTQLRTLRLGGRLERERVDHFERFLSEQFFDGQEIELIPSARDEGTVHVRLGKEAERPIYHLGDGIQQVIILTWPLFEHEGDDLALFIEEPELYLHPGLQTRLVQALIEHAKMRTTMLQVFATTHSNHLLDTTLDFQDMAVFRVEKSLDADKTHDVDAQFVVRSVSSSDRSTLEQLGVRNSSVMLSNCTIWVEGITDRLYLRRFLQLTQPDEPRAFMEDLHYSIVEYGGGNIVHWSFASDDPAAIQVDRLCARVLLICDRDDARWKDDRARAIADRLGDRFIRLESREIENVLAPTVIASVVAQYENQPGADAIDLRTIKHAQYQSKPLGHFIQTKLLRGPPRRKGGYKEKSGTLKSKLDFAMRAIDQMNSKDDLTSEALDIAKRVYNFIARHNPPH